MSYAKRTLETVRGHLATNRQRVANILIGPKREGWFNSEAFVAVNSVADLNAAETLIFYGEEQYCTILKKIFDKDEDAEDKPDLVGYRIKSDDETISLILEAKLVYAREKNIRAQMAKLATQMFNAKKIVPGAEVLGVIYACILGSDLGYIAQPAHFFEEVANEASSAVASGKWVTTPNISLIDGFRHIPTTMPFPQTAITFGVGGIVI